ncbi:facilitated trehalose transporter Tret1 [Eurytemora carolleeae]|uniref:facilitated trehalose transporter Tret1 n=1 Tax=Eurytemora carolleeae TaxID=1294199 RepID=UPI000C78C523|nr:facilitated trehalose transporter Tret1 [Eurytemora carolleeae]|eukprot:XP_023324721.1 facilitated trehalose transporter Tret1-like [Eurytemora affinis]
MSCRLIGPLYILGNLCISFSPDLKMLYFGRIVCGVASGLSSSPAAVYVIEISTPLWRTSFNAGLSAFYMFGTFLTYFLGKWIGWRALSSVSCIPPLLSTVLLCFIPESPSFLLTKGRNVEGKMALQWLRGDEYNIEKEYQELLTSVNKLRKDSMKIEENFLKKCLRDLMSLLLNLIRPDVWKPLLIIIIIMFLQQFTGLATISFYAVSIMESAGSSIDKYTATILYGLVRLLACFFGSYLIKKAPRKPLFIISSLLVSLGMGLLGLAVYLQEVQGVTGFAIGLLPLFSVFIVAISYQAGLGPIPWSYQSELFPVDLRSWMSGISGCISHLYVFLTIKTFPSVQYTFSPHGAYWFYACIGLLAAIFGATFLPDTKGKSLAEVSEYFTSSCCILRKRKKGESTSISEPVINSQEIDCLVEKV